MLEARLRNFRRFVSDSSRVLWVFHGLNDGQKYRHRNLEDSGIYGKDQ
jgi:hypothetical protein